jgi:hypothetical protein
VAVIATGTAACGGDDDSAASQTVAPTDASQAPTTEAPSTTPTTAAPLDPCTLVPKDKAEALAGTPLLDGQLVSQETSSCTYPGPTDGPTAQVEIFTGPGAQKNYDLDKTLDHAFTPVADLGDEAYLEEFTVFVRKAQTWAMIRLTLLEDPAAYNDKLVALARDVAAQL